MPEKFEPIKLVEGKKDIKEFQVDFSEQSLGELGKENSRLKNYLDGQTALVQKHLDAFKNSALKEYTGLLKWDNEKAVNQAMRDYSDEMNQLLEASTQDLTEIASKYGDLLGDRMTSETIDEHYKKVAAEFGPRLEARILSALNSRVGDIVKAAKARAEEPAAPVPAP